LSDATWDCEQPIIDLIDIEKSIRNNVCFTQSGEMRPVALNSYFPVTILNNIERWKDYLILDKIKTAPHVLYDF
jgi:hypothetical protein